MRTAERLWPESDKRLDVAHAMTHGRIWIVAAQPRLDPNNKGVVPG